MPLPQVLNRILSKYKRFPQITCKLLYYCAGRLSTFRSIKRKAYRSYTRKKMYRRRFFQYLRRKWLTCARGALAVKYLSPSLNSNSRANAAKGRGFANAFNTTATQTFGQLHDWPISDYYTSHAPAPVFELEEDSSSSSEL